MDDVWDDSGTDPSEVTRVERVHGNAGYLKGITETKALAHQPGFDEGYSEGAEIGSQAGNIIGTFQALGLSDLEKQSLKELAPQELFCSKYYNEEARPLFDVQHPLISKWSQRSQLYNTDVHNE